MNATLRLREPARALAAMIAVAVAYVVFAELGFELAFSTKQVTAVWAPAGIALAALVLGGYRLWPGVFVGAFAANVLNHTALAPSAMIAVGNTVGPLAGMYLLRRAQFDPALARVRDVLVFLLFGSLVAMTITATNGTLTLSVAKLIPWRAFGSVWSLWWGGDAMGALVVTPLILTWLTKQRSDSEGGLIERLALAILTPVVAWIAFTSGPLPLPVVLRHTSWVYPIAVWSALRFRQRETTTVIAAIAALAVTSIAGRLNPYATGSADQQLAGAMTFVAILAITAMVVSALTEERREARREVSVTLRRATHVARMLQEAMLPAELPRVKGIVFDAVYATAEEESLVGGDWYEAFVLPSGDVAVSVGDVTGHGVEAAVAAERARQAIFSAATDSSDPATILAKADQTLALQRTTFVATATVAIVDPQHREMRYATAGHPPPVVASPSQAAQLLQPGGLPLGIARSIAPGSDEPKTRTIVLAPRSLVVFYTDGLIEFERDVATAEARLLKSASRLAGDAASTGSAESLRRAVMGDAPPRDDTVVLTLRLQDAPL